MYPPANTQEFIAVWHRVLRDWLSWPESRIERFVSRFRPFVDREMQTDRSPAFYLAHALLPPSLYRQFEGLKRVQIEKEIEAAVVQDDPGAHLQPTYDWEAARERVKVVLAQHGSALPKPEDPTWWEHELEQST